MKKILILLLMLGLSCLPAFAEDNFIFSEDPTITESTQKYFDQRLKCVLEAPPSWNMDTSSQNYKVIFSPDKDQDPLVGLVTYISAEPVTVNAVYLRRSGSKWDRWHLLRFKEQDEKHNFLKGVNESISAIYLKKKMDNKLQIHETLVAEDIYIKDETRVCIVTARGTKARWFQYKDEIKKILGSFFMEE